MLSAICYHKPFKNDTNRDLCGWPRVSWKSSGFNSWTKSLLCRVISQSSSTDAKSMFRRHREVFNTFVSMSLRTLCESVTKLHSLIICSGELSLITTPSLSNRVGVHLEVCKRTSSSLELGELLSFLDDESLWECDNIGRFYYSVNWKWKRLSVSFHSEHLGQCLCTSFRLPNKTTPVKPTYIISAIQQGSSKKKKRLGNRLKVFNEILFLPP